ncbi:MAG: 1-acyl-sn-glycerol-3-phosphate acyltransferase, partial [Oscillospiraceae bacterium]|nr:1-acyl-sn-glycerol-3-phosphate acyltransferase [Oscillospiraceae bacterium]
PVKAALSLPGWISHKPKITYENNVRELRGPFLLLCNHNAFLDFKIASRLLGKNDANYVVAIDGYIGREWLMRRVGCICKRKFTNDLSLVKQLRQVISMGNVAVIYPEARYSLCGTTAVLPKSLGKLAKFLDVPVVTLICHGHHINSPFWDTSHERGVKGTEASYKQLLTREQVREMDANTINAKIAEAFRYDDFAWQKEKGIKVSDPKRADGLHKVLYQCPHCGTEYRMSSYGVHLKCNACGKQWEMTELGELCALSGETEFSHIPDWYEWERENVRKEVEAGTYSSGTLKVKVESLPNSKKYIPLGEGTMIHDMNGFRVSCTDSDGDSHEMVKSVASMYSCHIEYRYLFKHGDCVDLNTLRDTWYIYPEGDFAVTKMALATEELYRNELIKKGVSLTEGIM